MNILYFKVSLPFSGKSTLAKKIAEGTNSILISFDSLFYENADELQINRNPEGWDIIRALAQNKIQELLSSSSVVYDDISMLFDHREQLRQIARSTNSKAALIYVDTPIDIIQQRQRENNITKKRDHNIPENFKLILSKFEIPKESEDPIIFKPETIDDELICKLNDSPLSR
ncbi:ATP-binding protein [Candidatus Roizmanbacteria bacterium]|nr:ATP-binding protein [Candidatus Roizmanbacteria bacterium]